jgi:tRNA pseudouridine55 synthase
LDPYAEGLLLILAGGATRLMDLIHEVPKTYVAEVSWGVETDSGDLHGRPTFTGSPSALNPAALDAALRTFIGWREQVPPATSAKKIGGEPAYKKAHRGEAVELPASRVYLHRARWLGHSLPQSSTLELVCRGGFYVRALARDLGRRLGCGAHLTRLARTAIGPWIDPDGPAPWLHGRALVPWYPSRLLTDAEVGALRKDELISAEPLSAPDWPLPRDFSPPRALVRAFHRDRLVALLERSETGLRPAAWFRGGL